GDHRRVFGDEEHGEFEAGVFGVEASDEFGFCFGKIERSTVSFCDRCGEKADETDDLRKQEAVTGPADDIPTEKANVLGVVLLLDDALSAERVRHEENADDGHGESEFIADHLRRTTQAAEKRIF